MAATTARKYKFKAEVNQVLNLVVNSLYSNKEIFLRELVSNASDALDKLSFRALEDKSLSQVDDPAIRLIVDEEAKTLAIEDDGIGMTRDELQQNLGTIAHSGTQQFLEQVAKSNDVRLIGQFGVGFYSAFLVADRVEVTTRAAGSDEAWVWASTADGSYTLSPAERDTHGTQVLLHLKEDQTDYAQAWRLKGLVRKYSDFTSHPIRMLDTPYVPEGEEPKEPTWETVNSASALWMRPKSEITQEQYDQFYEHVTGDFQGVLGHTHFKIEGTQMFSGLLYVPQKLPFDMLSAGDAKRGVRLYVKRVFIMDDCEELVPQWLRFVRGVIDSDDLPLNVSRELLQDSSIVRTIRKQVIRKTLDLLESMARDRPQAYADFWKEFGAVLKEGLHYEPEYKERLAKLVRYASTKTEGSDVVSLEEYVSRMPEGQKDIYYVTGMSVDAVANSPHLEALRKRDYEVLYMVDPVDEWAVPALAEFDDHKLVNATHADLDLEQTEEEKQEAGEAAKDLEPLLNAMKSVLEDRISEVRVSSRLTDSPVCLVVPPGGLNSWMRKLLEAQDQAVPPQKRILEVNPKHVLVERLRGLAGDEGDSTQLAQWVEVLYGQALIAEGSPLTDPGAFSSRLVGLLEKAALTV